MYTAPWLLNLRNQHHYTLPGEAELRVTRKSDTIFIFGSGYSINDITEPEWSHFEQHDPFSFSWFLYQDFVHIAGTLTDCAKFAYLLGWKNIVLAGVDLYDRGYFWLSYEDTREDEREGYESPRPSLYG
jgi:hypothetical protein